MPRDSTAHLLLSAASPEQWLDTHTEKLAAFYVDLTGWPIVRNDGGWITIRTPDGQEVAFQPSEDHIPPQWPGQECPATVPHEAHLDILVDDLDVVQARAVELGATVLRSGSSQSRTLADPVGHPFDLSL